MAIIQINTDPSRKQLRQFGFIWLGFLVLFGTVAWFKLDTPSLAKTLWSLAIVVPVIGWLVPTFMRWVFVGLSFAAFPIGFVVSHVLLAAVYYLVVTPIGLLVRAFGHDAMKRKFDREARTYWIPRNPHPKAEQYFRQY